VVVVVIFVRVSPVVVHLFRLWEKQDKGGGRNEGDENNLRHLRFLCCPKGAGTGLK
jgi:hypothetical protein